MMPAPVLPRVAMGFSSLCAKRCGPCLSTLSAPAGQAPRWHSEHFPGRPLLRRGRTHMWVQASFFSGDGGETVCTVATIIGCLWGGIEVLKGRCFPSWGGVQPACQLFFRRHVSAVTNSSRRGRAGHSFLCSKVDFANFLFSVRKKKRQIAKTTKKGVLFRFCVAFFGFFARQVDWRLYLAFSPPCTLRCHVQSPGR